jgi:acetylornithine deacetylase/succinyl-diaminopimelate desuccinylase-like protein
MTAEQQVLSRTVELAEIPAPTGQEDARRDLVRSWWQRDGWADVRADPVGNVWARVRPGGEPAVVLAAHLDTVFDAAVDQRARRIIAAPPAGVTVEVEELGRRPAGELPASHPLAAAAAAALRGSGIPPVFTAASTDANAAHAAGVPAIAIGVTTGGGEHTPEEWIDTAPLAAGLRCAADTIARWEGVAHEHA